jgi:hypothetical protein
MIMLIYIRLGGGLQGITEFGQFGATGCTVKERNFKGIFQLFDTFTQTLL